MVNQGYFHPENTFNPVKGMCIMRPLLLKSSLLRFFLSFLVLTTSTLIVVSLFTYVNYQHQILNESSEVSKKMLFQMQFAVEFVDRPKSITTGMKNLTTLMQCWRLS